MDGLFPLNGMVAGARIFAEEERGLTSSNDHRKGKAPIYTVRIDFPLFLNIR